ncbi:MAG TPA: branched-chain amino acid aminotransferase [Clostridia bacterium]|nr:MAG: Branched-chain-amino-acid aminotransferase 2 [Firmicutes bacterium ADurb.Bin146]HOD92522.1 branched-chain amino acid aminotransferase [Clostridia bacterium]HQM39180.1 branched-chain amino acid aminotransferase [Clostridia bacterium]
MNISIKLTSQPKTKPDEKKLSFGKQFTDHMFLMNYSEDKGWHDARIVPYGPLSIDPSTNVLHYGQGVFEGLKAYRTKENKVLLFRPDENAKRLRSSCERLCIPPIEETDVVEAIVNLIKTDIDWVPSSDGTSLYVRPFIISTDPFLGVHPSHTYLFLIILSPVGPYYPTGLNPTSIYVEDFYKRASKGGMGHVKTMGNYAASLIAQEKAIKLNCIQTLWLDAHEGRYIEEVGAMNVFFVIGDTIVTPELSGSILPGITRKSTLELAHSLGYKTQERKITIDEVVETLENGQMKECFGTGTAAVISPVGELIYKDIRHTINNNKIGVISQTLYDTLTGIQYGRIKDTKGWTVQVK